MKSSAGAKKILLFSGLTCYWSGKWREFLFTLTTSCSSAILIEVKTNSFFNRFVFTFVFILNKGLFITCRPYHT